MFDLIAHEKEIIEYRLSDSSEGVTLVIKQLINDGLASFEAGTAKAEKKLKNLIRIREKALTSDEDYACYYEEELFKFARMIASATPVAEKKEEKTLLKKGGVRLGWNGLESWDGEKWEATMDTSDEDLQMESNYKSHATKEGFGKITEHKKPSEACKEAGLKSLKQLSEITGESVQTLNNWSKNKPKLFNVVVQGAKGALPSE